MSIEDLDQRTREFLTRAPNNLPVRTEAARVPARVTTRFSVFIPEHERRALALAKRFIQIADSTPGDAGLEKVLEEAERDSREEDMELVRYALMLFITHHPEGRRLPIPPIEQRSPQWVVPSKESVRLRGVVALGALEAEAQLDYFREDTAINDHHSKWHVVYPWPGDPNTGKTKDRQGELFWYMHQQMLARYDAERRAFGLARVVPLSDYRQPIAEGYEANLASYSNRPPNAVLHDLTRPSYKVADHETRRDRIIQAGKDGFLLQNGSNNLPVTPTLLGDTIEANVAGADGPEVDQTTYYGHLHNFGHVLLADLHDPKGPSPNQPGVMISTSTAVRDPVFFRWHKHIDDLFVAWHERLPANDFSDAPTIEVRKQLPGSADEYNSPDIIFCLAEKLPNWGTANFDGQKYGESRFGGDANWLRAPSDFPFTTTELRTLMREEQIRQQDGTVTKKPYLDHDEFVYFVRLENSGDKRQDVTARVFIAPSEWAFDDRRVWIEMDKFTYSLKAKQKAVVYRSERYSSVVRKPAHRPSEPKPHRPPGSMDMNYCDCGWPLHVFLPRGTATGMEFRVFVIVTDLEHDMVAAEKKCGSMSFCGARDAKYPDKRAMGYPFDRPFSNKSIAETIAAQTNMAVTTIKIKHTG